MKTVVLRIGAETDGKRPLQLFFEQGGDWWNQPLASESLSSDLSVDPAETLKDGTIVDRTFALAAFSGAASSSERVEAIGKYLFRLVSTGSVGKAWAALRKQYPGEQPSGAPATEGLRLFLDLAGDFSKGDHELKALPWELMVDPPRPPVFRDVANPVVIGSFAPNAATPAENWPLRVLVVVGFREEDDDVNWREELLAIQEVLVRQRQLVDFEVLIRPEADPLRDRIRKFQPHVLHFIGHGALQGGTERPALLFHRPATGDHRFWTAAGIIGDLNGLPPIPFVFLNACRSTAPSSAGHRWELAGAFLEAKVHAVLAMRGDVRGDVAACFAERVYQALTSRQSLDVAVAEARGSAERLPSLDSSAPDWAMACLQTTIHPDDVLPMKLGLPKEIVDQIEQEESYCNVSVLVDRYELRRELALRIDPPPGIVAKPLTIVSGDTEHGKSCLVQWCLYRSALRGRQVLFVDLDRKGSLNYVGVLEAIARGETRGQSRIRGPIAPKAMQHFLYDADRLLRKQAAADWDGQAVPDQLTLPNKNMAEKLAEQIFKRFARALAEATQEQPLILALDHVDRGVQPDHFGKYVVKYLVLPISAGEIKNVQLVLAVRDRKASGLGSISETACMEVRAFPLAEFASHAIEYIQLRGYPRETRGAFRNFIESVPPTGLIGDPWPPTALQQLLGKGAR